MKNDKSPGSSGFTADFFNCPSVVRSMNYGFEKGQLSVTQRQGIATRRVPHVEQNLLILPDHLRSPPVLGGVRVAKSLVFYVVSSVLLFVYLSFYF